jgi:hypothetical protein
MSLPGRSKGLLRLGGIGRETFVVVSVGGLVAATAFLPRVVGEPGRQQFALPPWPVAKSAQVTAPIFAPLLRHGAKPGQQEVLTFAPRPISIPVATPISHSQPPPRRKRPVETPIARAGHKATTPAHVAPQPVPQPKPAAVAPTAPIVPPQTVLPAPVAQPQPVSPPAEIAPSSPTTPSAPTLAPSVVGAVSAGIAAVVVQPPVPDSQVTALTSANHDSSTNAAKSHNQDNGNSQKQKAIVAAILPAAQPATQQILPVVADTSQGKSSAAADAAQRKDVQHLAPAVAVTTTPTPPTASPPQQPSPATIVNSPAPVPSQGFPSGHDRRHGSDQPTASASTPTPTAPTLPEATPPQPPAPQQSTPPASMSSQPTQPATSASGGPSAWSKPGPPHPPNSGNSTWQPGSGRNHG